MAKLLKVLGIVFGALVGLVVIAMVAVSLFFDPNDYKAEIAAAVEESTGRALTLEGDLELELFPRLRIAVGEAALANAAGFGEEPFARIQSARLQLGLIPLIFSQSLQIDEARLEGLTLNLARDAQGRDNWQDLGGAGATAEPATPEPQAAPSPEAVEVTMTMTFEVDAIVIDSAEVNWVDAAAGTRWQLADFNLELADLEPDAAFPMSISFALTGDELAINLAAEMQASLGLDDNIYTFEDLVVDIDGSGAAWPGGEGALALSFDTLTANLDEESVDLQGLALEFLNLNVTGNLSGRQLFTGLSLTGAVEIAEFDPRELMEVFSVAIETADPDVLRRVSATAELAYDANRMMLEQMDLVLDDSALTGSAGYRGETLSFDLTIDSINADRYLPPAEEPAQEEQGSLDEVDLPLDALRDFDAAGRMVVGALQFSGLSFSDVAFQFSAQDGRVRFTPSASLYGGRYAGEIGIDVQADTALLTLEQQLTEVDAGALGEELLDSRMFTGTANLQMDLSATGANLGAVRRALDGNVSFALTDGTWEGVDMWYEMRRAKALFDQVDAPARDAGDPRTPFSSISATGVIEDAVLTNRDLSANLDFMTLTGAGTVNLLTDEMSFDLTARVADGERVQADPLMADLTGDELPLRVRGSLTAPSVSPDYSAMVRAEVEEAVDERVEEEREELRERVQDRLRGILER
ncbi:MAG TPA: AsmA family protein [Gammaproteobacteria bacterium]|jgi:AsmA protein